mgnify:CR=1 FL=1
MIDLPAFVWSPEMHSKALKPMRQAILTMTMIRSLVAESPLSMLPNELLFEIFVMLEPWYSAPEKPAVNTWSEDDCSEDDCSEDDCSEDDCSEDDYWRSRRDWRSRGHYYR